MRAERVQRVIVRGYFQAHGESETINAASFRLLGTSFSPIRNPGIAAPLPELTGMMVTARVADCGLSGTVR